VVRRRPETVADLAASLGIPPAACFAAVRSLVDGGLATTDDRSGATYVVATTRGSD
jgi:DNA-binding IclR family transcriptional regulator